MHRGPGPPVAMNAEAMEDLKLKRLVQSRIRRAQSALDRASGLLETGSHVETIETTLVTAMSEVMEAEKLLQPLWQAPPPVHRREGSRKPRRPR